MDQTSGIIKFHLNSIAAIGILISGIALFYKLFYVFLFGSFISLIGTNLSKTSAIAFGLFLLGLVVKSYTTTYHYLLIYIGLLLSFYSFYKVWLKPQKNLVNIAFYYISAVFISLSFAQTIDFHLFIDNLEIALIIIFSLLFMITYGIRFNGKPTKTLEDFIKLSIILLLGLGYLFPNISIFIPSKKIRIIEGLTLIITLLLLFWSIRRLIINRWEGLEQTFKDVNK
ncbi:hypothetical protein BKI52_04030 [marine bacterium AO1-C]|nr:hypothetical protein BKI52_04030 [marine bacterium AO1-C]